MRIHRADNNRSNTAVRWRGKELSLHSSTATTQLSVGARTYLGRLMVVTPSGKQSSIFHSSTIEPRYVEPRRENRPTTASQWLQRHTEKLKKYTGEWLAVTHNGIIAHSSNFGEVFVKAKQKGISNPLVFKVPKPTDRLRIVSVKVQ